MALPRLIQGGLAADDRGEVSFVNEFTFAGIKRFYVVSNHRTDFVRAWHGHKHEEKYITVVSGAAVVCAVKIDNWEHPSKKSEVQRYVLSAAKPGVLYVPKGYANGFMTLTRDTKLIFFSTASVEESMKDDIRFESRYWDPWQVTER